MLSICQKVSVISETHVAACSRKARNGSHLLNESSPPHSFQLARTTVGQALYLWICRQHHSVPKHLVNQPLDLLHVDAAPFIILGH